jgi:hypothetical protein
MPQTIIVKNKIENMSKSKDFYKAGDIYDYEFSVLQAYFGNYMRNPIKCNVIIDAYFKCRKHVVDMLALWVNDLDRRRKTWEMLETMERFMGLPFRSIDGRDGLNFDQSMPLYAKAPTKKIMVSLNDDLKNNEAAITKMVCD